MLPGLVNLAEDLAVGDHAVDGDEVVEGVEVEAPRRIGVVLPATPDIKDSLPLAVMEREILHRFQVKPDRHAAGSIGGDVLGGSHARIG